MRLRRGVPVLAVLLAGALAAGCGTASSPSLIPTSAPSAPSAGRLAPGTVDGWTTGSPQSLGLRGSALRAGARRARRLDSTCFAVVRKGRLVRDWNWRLRRTDYRDVFSITKSVASALVGIAIRDGDLRLDDLVSSYVPQWRGTPSESVTVSNLVSNDSGRFWSLQSDYRALQTARSRTRYAVGLSQQYTPGSAWAYNNSAIQVLEPVLEQATGMSVARFARKRLFEPLGMTHTTFTTDRLDNDPDVRYGVKTTCLDLARLGMLYLGSGKVTGTRVLDRGYVRRSIGRSSTPHNAAYGLLWWLNRSGRLRSPTDAVDAQGQPLAPITGQLAPFAPSDLFAAIGFGGQVLLVDPSSQTMVIRLGLPARPGEEAYTFATAARVLVDAVR